MDWEQKADNLERGLINGTVPGTFLIQNASSREWYQVMVNLSKKARDSGRLRPMLRGILKGKTLGKKMASKGAKIIGIGSAALKILNLLKNLEIYVKDILFLDNDDWTLEESCFTNLKLPWANMLFMTRRKDGEYVPLSWGGIHHGGPCLGRLMALGSVKQIAGMFEDVNSVIMVATLGGATGSGASPVTAGVLREMGINLNTIVQIPFPFEGKKRAENTLESLEVIQEYANNVIIVDGKEVLKSMDHSVTLLNVYKALNLKVANLVKDIYQGEFK